MTSREKELAVGVAAVRHAAQLCQAVQSKIRDGVFAKEDRSPVTIADFGSQAIVCRRLQNELGDISIVGEEDSADLRESTGQEFLDRICSELRAVEIEADGDQACEWIDIGNGEPSESFWTLDPIDGTKGFLRGKHYAISLGLIENGEITVAVLGCPRVPLNPDDDDSPGSLYYAIRGQGAFVTSVDESDEGSPFQFGEGTQVSVSDIDDWSQVRLCESYEARHSAHGRAARVADALGVVQDSVRLDSQAKYAIVASGRAEVYLRLPVRRGYEEKIWDHAGGALVVEEAGGMITDIQGRPLDFSQGRTLAVNRGVAASNGKNHDQLLKVLADTEPKPQID